MKKIINYIPDGSKFLVDWLSVSFRQESGMTPSDILEVLCSILGCEKEKFVYNERGLLAGYNRSFRYLDEKLIAISYNEGNKKQGILLNVTGQGCKFLSKQNLFDIFKFSLDKGGYFTRLDIAFDDLDQKLPLHLIRNVAEAVNVYYRDDSLDFMISSKSFKESFKTFTNSFKSSFNNCPNLTIGTRYGLCMVRYYNKAVEQKLKDKYWWRCELQLKMEYAEKMVRHLLDGNFVPYFVQLLLSHSRFLDGTRSSTVTHIPTHPDFELFLQYLLEEHELESSLNLYLNPYVNYSDVPFESLKGKYHTVKVLDVFYVLNYYKSFLRQYSNYDLLRQRFPSLFTEFDKIIMRDDSSLFFPSETFDTLYNLCNQLSDEL